MARGSITRLSGVNGLIYVSGNEIAGANAWELNIEHATVEGARFGDTWNSNEPGMMGWSGSITALHDTAQTYLYLAATQDSTASLVIYPSGSTLTKYWSGNAVFSFKASGDTDSLVGESADFTGAGSLTRTWS